MRWLIAAMLLAASTARAEHLPTIEDVFDARAGLPTIDDAFPDAIRIGEGNSDVDLARVRATTGELTWIALDLVPPRAPRMWHRRPAEAVIPIALPPAVRVLGFELQRGDAEPSWAIPIRAERAAGAFATLRGPALLERTGASGGVEHLQLHLLVRPNESTTIRIAIAAPDPLRLALVATAPVTVDGARRAVVELPGGLARSAPSRASERAALLADVGGIRTLPIIDFFCCAAPPAQGQLDKQIIRREVHLHRPAVRHCYEQRAMRVDGLAGTVQLHFTIRASGAVEDVSVDGELEDGALRACIAQEAARWRFPEAKNGGAVEVNYPFTFQSL